MRQSQPESRFRAVRGALSIALMMGLLFFGAISFRGTELRILDIHQLGPTNGFRLTWSSVVSNTYQLQRSDNLASSTNWVSVTTIQATGTTATADDTSAAAVQRFYRVIQLTNSAAGDTQPPSVVFADAQMATLSDGSPAFRLIFAAGDNVGVSSVTVQEGTNTLGSATPQGGSNWAFLVSASISQLQARFFSAVARDPSGHQGQSLPVGLMAVDPDLFTPLDNSGQPNGNRPLLATSSTQVGPFVYHPGGRPRPGAAPDFFLRFPDGATLVPTNGGFAIQFVRVSGGFETNSPFSLGIPLQRNSGSLLQLNIGPLAFSDLAATFNLNVTNGLPLVAFGQFPLNWRGGQIDDRGLVGAQFQLAIPNLPLPTWSLSLGNLLTEFATEHTLRVPLSGTFALPDGTADGAQLQVGDGTPLWLTLRNDGHISLEGPVQLQWPSGANVRADLKLNDPEYCLSLSASSIHVQTLSNLVQLLPANPTACLINSDLTTATACVDSFARAYSQFSAAVVASGSNAPVSAAPPPDGLNVFGEILEAYAYSALAGAGQGLQLPFANIADEFGQTTDNGISHDNVNAMLATRDSMLRAKLAAYNHLIATSPDDDESLDVGLSEVEAAVVLRANESDATADLASMRDVAGLLLEGEGLRQQANLPAGPLLTNALAKLFGRFANKLADTYGVQTNVLVPDTNPKINTLNRFVAIEVLRDVFGLLSDSASAGIDLRATRLNELTAQLGVQLFRGINTALNTAEATNDLPGFILAAQDFVELRSWVQQGTFPDVPELSSLKDDSAITTLGNRLDNLLTAELQRPFGQKTLGRQSAEIRALLGVLRGIPGTVTFEAPSIQRAYDQLEQQLNLAVNPTALAAETNIQNLVQLLEAGTLHRELSGRFQFPQVVSWESNRLGQVGARLGALAESVEGWRELDQSVRLLINSANQANLNNDQNLRRAYLLEAATLLGNSRNVAGGLMHNAGGLLRAIDLALPGDIILDHPSGFVCWDRIKGEIYSGLKGSLSLPKFGFTLTVPNASFNSGGKLDLSAFGTLNFGGGQLAIPSRKPLHFGFSPARGFSCEGDARLSLSNGLRLDASISLKDPMYCFGLEARGMEFDLGSQLVLSRIVIPDGTIQTFGSQTLDALGDYFHALNGASETLLAAATNFPPVDETGFGRPPEFSTPEISFDLAPLDTWSSQMIAGLQTGVTNGFGATLQPLLDWLQRADQDTRAAMSNLQQQASQISYLDAKTHILNHMKAGMDIAAAYVGKQDEADVLGRVNAIVRTNAQDLASLVAAMVTPDLPDRFADSLDQVRLLRDVESVLQGLNLPDPPAANLPTDPCAACIFPSASLSQRAEALAMCAAQRQALGIGMDPATGTVTNTTIFNALSEFDLYQRSRLLAAVDSEVQALGEDSQFTGMIAQLLRRQRSLLTNELATVASVDRQLELIDLIADNIGFGAVGDLSADEEGALTVQLGAALTSLLQRISPDDFIGLKVQANTSLQRRSTQIATQLHRALGYDRKSAILFPKFTWDIPAPPDFMSQLKRCFNVLAQPVPPDLVSNLSSLVAYETAQLQAQPFTPQFFTNRLADAEGILNKIIGLTDWADAHPPNTSVLTNLQFTMTNLTLSFTAAAELQQDWWLLQRYRDVLGLHTAVYGSNLVAGFNQAGQQAQQATVQAAGHIANSFSNLFSSIVTSNDVIIPLPGKVDITRIFGQLCYDRTVGQFSGCFGGRVEFPDIGTNVFFDISQACLNSDGSYNIAASTAAPLPFGRASLSSSLNVSGGSSGIASFNGLGTITVPNGSAGNRVFNVALSYDQAQERLGLDAQGSNLDLRFGDDFAVFNAGFGFDLSTVSPQGAFRANGSAGMIARQHPLPVSINRTNFQVVADNVAAVFTYSSNAFALSLTNGTLSLPEIFQAGACPTNSGQPSGPQIGLAPGTPITVSVGTGTNPAVGFSGGLQFQNLGFAVPGLTNLTVEICSAQLILQSNAIPYLTNLQATVTLPLPTSPQIAILDITNGAWAVNGYPVGTVTLRSNLTLLDSAGFRFSLPGANDAFCGNGTSLTVSNDANGTFFILNGGARFDIPSSVLGDDSGGALSLTTCGSFTAGQNRAPQFAVNTLSFNGTFRLGGAGGLRIENAQLALNGLQNVFNPSVANPWSLSIGGVINVPNGPQLAVSNLRFVFEGNPVPRIDPGGFSLASTNGLIPVPGMPFNVTAASLTFIDGTLGFPQILTPSNLKITLSATMNIPPGSSPLVSGQVSDLSLQMSNGLPQASINGIGVSFQGLEFPPISIGGQVYIGGLNALGQGSIDDIFFAGKVGGTLNDVGIRGLFAFNMHGLIGYCLDVNAGPAGIPLDGGALGGFLLTGASGGVSFQSGNGDPCSFSTYYPVGSDGRPIPNNQLPPDIVTNRPGALRTWDAHSDQLTRDHARAQLAVAAAAAAQAISATNPPPPPPQGGTNPVVNVPTFPCPGGDCPPPTINILCQPHPDTNQFPNRVIIKFTALDESRLNDFGITRSFIQGLGASTAQQIADTISFMVSSNISLLIPRADPAIFTQTFADQLNQQITNDLAQLQVTLDGIILNAVTPILGNSDNVYDAIKAAAYGGVPCPDVTVKLTGTFSHAAVSTVLSATAGVTLSSSGSAGVVGTLNAMGVPVGRIEEFIAVTDSHGNPNPALCGEAVFAVGPIDVGRVDMHLSCDGCMTAMLNSFGSLVSCAGNAETLAILARVKPSVTNLPIPQAIATLTNSEKAAFIATLFSLPPVPGLFDCFLSSASNAVLNFSPSYQICGEVKPKLFGFSLSPSAVSFNAGASRSNLAGSITFSPSFIIQNTLLCAAEPTCIPLFPGFDEATMGFAMGIPDPAPIFLAGLRGDLSSPQALSNVASNGFQTFLENATITIGYDIAPLGLKLASAQGRVVMPNLVQHPARPGNIYIPPENRGITNLPSRVDVLLQALSIDYLKNPLWKGDVNDLPTIFPAGSPQQLAIQGLSFNVDYFPYGGLLGAGQLNLPKLIYDAPPPELGTLLNGTNLLQQLSAASTLITDYILTTTNVGSVGFYVPAPNPPFFTYTNGQPLSPIDMLNAIKTFDGTASAFTNLYSPQFAFFRGFVNGQLLGVPVASAQLDMVPAGLDSHFLLHAAIPTNSWLKSFIDSALLNFDMRGSPTQSIDTFFTNLLTQVQIATGTNDPVVQQRALISAQNSIDAALPKISLDLQVNNFRVPDAISNVLAANASAEVVAFSPRYNPTFVGTGVVANVTRNGGVAFRGQFNFANYVSIPNAELAVALRPLALPELSGAFDVAALNVPGLPLNSAHFSFDSDPPVGGPYLAASGAINPFSFINPLNSQPLLTIRNLTNSTAQISASFSLNRVTVSNDIPLPSFSISPSRIDMPILGPNLTAIICGATTNDPFTFSSTAPWTNNITILGQLSIRDPLNTNSEIVRIGAVGQQFSALLSGNGMQMSQLTIVLPTNITVIAFPGTASAQTNVLSSGGCPNLLSISANGSLILSAGMAANLDLTRYGFGVLSAGGCFALTNSQLTLSGTISGGALTNGGSGFSVSGTMIVTTNSVVLNGSATFGPMAMGVFVVSSTNGGPLTAALMNGGLSIPGGATLKIQTAGYPTNASDLFTLSSFAIFGNGDLSVAATNNGMIFPGAFSLTGGSFTLFRSNGVASLDIFSPTLTVFQGQSYATAITSPFQHAFMDSTGVFYADTGTRQFGLPSAFSATGRLEIGFEPNSHSPSIGVATNSISFGTVNYGSSSNRLITITNTSSTGNGAPLVATISASPANAFTVSPFSLNLDPGDIATVSVRFTPPSAGVTNGALTILHNAGPSVSIPTSGTGLAAPILHLSSTNVAFGSVHFPQTNLLTLRFDNVGLTNLVVTNTIASGPFSASPTNFTIAPGSNFVATISYFATNVGTLAGTLQVRGNDSAAIRTVALSGSTFSNQWYLQREGPEKLTSVAMNSSRKGFAVGWKGSVLNTTNGGHSWQKLVLTNGASINFSGAALAANGTDGMIVAGLLATTNAGASFTSLNLPLMLEGIYWYGAAFLPNSSREILAGQCFLNCAPSEFFARAAVAQSNLGTNLNIFGTTNSPFNLQPATCAASALVGAGTNIIIGGHAGRLVSTNGGATWTVISDGITINSVGLQSGGLGLLSSPGGILYRTQDGGATIVPVFTNVDGFTVVTFLSSTVGYAADYKGNVFRGTNSTINGPVSAWFKEETLAPISGLTAAGSQLWAVGDNGAIYTRPVSPPTTGILTFEPAKLDYGFVPLNGSQPLPLTLYNRGPVPLTVTNITVTNAAAAEIAFSATFPLTIAPGSNVTLNAFYNPSVSNSLTGQLVISSGDPDGPQFVNLNGRSLLKGWVLRPSLTNSVGRTVLDVQMLTDLVGYALTSADLYKTTDGGETWRQMGVTTILGPLLGMNFFSTNVGWVCGGTSAINNGADGYIFKTVNGGTNWTTTYSATNFPVAKISMVNSNVGYAITSSHQSGLIALSGLVLQTVNGGTSWVQTNTPPAFPFNGIALATPSTSTIFASSGSSVYRSTDFGATWTTNFSTSVFVRDVMFLNTSDGWIVGDKQIFSRTTTGGSSWSPVIPLITTNAYNNVHFFTASSGLIAQTAASSAAIWRSDDGGSTIRNELGDSPLAGPGNLIPTVVFSRPDTNGWALGTDGCVRKYETFSNVLDGIVVVPPVLDLGSAPVGSNVFRTFNLFNKGDATLSVSNLLVDGVSRTNSSYRITNAIPFSVLTNASIPIGVIALNTDPGPTNATLSIVSDGAAQTVNVQLRSAAVPADQVVTFQTDPPGLSLVIDGTNVIAPASYTITTNATTPGQWLPDSTHSVQALDLQTVNGQTFAFASWDGGEDELFTNSFPLASATYLASYVTDDPPPGAGSSSSPKFALSGARIAIGEGPLGPLVLSPPSGITNGPWLRLSQATITAPVLGNFSMNGAALLSANLIQLSLASSSIRLPTNASQPAVVEVTSGSWQFLRSNTVTRLSVASPGLKLLSHSVTPPANLNLDFAGTTNSPTFSGVFSLTNGWKPAPGLLEFGSSSLTVGFTNFISLASTGQVRALKKPDGTWGVTQNLNLQFRDGPFTNTLILPSSIMQIFLPGTATQFLQVHGGASSTLSFFRDATGVFGLSLTNLSLDMMGQTLTSLSGSANTAGLISLTVNPPSQPFTLGQFGWIPNGSSLLNWNVKNGALGFHLAGGTVTNSGSIHGWAGGLSFPDLDLDSQGDFTSTMTLPGFTFDGISLGLADDAADRYVTFKRHNGVLSMRLRDKQDIFDGYGSVGFDFDSSGNVSGFFNSVFGVDFGFPLGYIPFGSVSSSYDSTRTPYQFTSQVNLGGVDFRVKFGSAGISACHLICGPTGCIETLCLP